MGVFRRGVIKKGQEGGSLRKMEKEGKVDCGPVGLAYLGLAGQGIKLSQVKIMRSSGQKIGSRALII